MNGHGELQALRAEPHANAPDRLNGQRAAMEQLLEWADHLAPAERSLVRCAYDWGVSSREIALLTGQTPRVIHRRLRALLQRINSPAFRFVMQAMTALPDDRRRVARLVVLQGQTQRQAAAQLGISVHSLRRELLAIGAMCEIAQEFRAPRRSLA